MRLPVEALARVRPYALQAGFFLALGAGAKALRHLTRVPLVPAVQARERLVAQHPGLAACASRFAELDKPWALERLLDQLESALAMVDNPTPATQFHLSYLTADVVTHAKGMCRVSDVRATDAAFRAALTCHDEVLPLMQEHLDDLLHNHLLDRAR